MSIVPQVIRPFCEGKAIYWLDEEMQGKVKGEDTYVSDQSNKQVAHPNGFLYSSP